MFKNQYTSTSVKHTSLENVKTYNVPIFSMFANKGVALTVVIPNNGDDHNWENNEG